MASPEAPEEKFSPSSVAVVCLGMAGSGKTTLMQRLNVHLHGKNAAPYLINLDPAVDFHQRRENSDGEEEEVEVPPYEANLDIRETINFKELMTQRNWGPNGAILGALNIYATKVDQFVEMLEKRANGTDGKKAYKHFLVDTPGQIEAFAWSASGMLLLESMALTMPVVIAYVVDAPRTSKSRATFVSNMLYACSILYKTKLPMIIVFTKTDVMNKRYVRRSMKNLDALHEALFSEENEGESNGGEDGTRFVDSLVSSTSQVLEEFYKHLSMVTVDSMTGRGINKFFKAVEKKRQDFLSDYKTELDRMKREREQQKQESRRREMQRMMHDMNVGGAAAGSSAMDVASDYSNDDDDDDDDEYSTQADGLQERYQAAMGEEQDSILADASFAKYLHKQR